MGRSTRAGPGEAPDLLDDAAPSRHGRRLTRPELKARRRGQRRASPDRRRAARHLPVWRHRFERGRRPRAACERRRPSTRSRSASTSRSTTKESSHGRSPGRSAPTTDEIRLTEVALRLGARHGRRYARSADVRRLELVLHLQGGSRGGAHGRAGRHRRRRAVRRLSDLSRCTDAADLEPPHADDSGRAADAGRPARQPDARRRREARRLRRRAGPSCRRWFVPGEDLTALYQLAYALFLPDFQERLLSDDAGQRSAVLRPDTGTVGIDCGRRPPGEVARVHRRRARAAVVPGGAAAARHRRRQHGGVARDAPAAGRQRRCRGRRSASG